MKSPMLYRAARREGGQDARERSLIGLRWQAVRLLRLFGIDQLDEPEHAARRGSVRPDG